MAMTVPAPSGSLARLAIAAAALLGPVGVSSAVDVNTLSTQTGTDATWQQLLAANARG